MGLFFTVYFVVFIWSSRTKNTSNKAKTTPTPQVAVSPVESSTLVMDKKIEIVDCNMKPEVAEVLLDSLVPLKNADQENHIMKIGDNYTFSIFGQEEISILVNFDDRLGDFSVTCDNKSSGTLRITAQ